MATKISDLITELTTQIATLPEFTDKSFSIYNVEEIEYMSQVGYPLAAVAYEGGDLVENKASPVARSANAAGLYRVSFTVILAVEYRNALSGDDTKVDALDLMDSVKQALMGFQGVNNRPWKFGGESPINGGLEGVIFYGQLWQTDIPVIGTSLHP